MNLLLDTHAFIWYVEGKKELSLKARNAIRNPESKSSVSVATLWEIAIKISIGKLELGKPFDNVLEYIEENGIEVLPIRFAHTREVRRLRFHHRDPFDRMLIAQTRVEAMTIVSSETVFDKYGVKRIW
jgi:PIN domain nuclease of toxin-antitoxin system